MKDSALLRFLVGWMNEWMDGWFDGLLPSRMY